jgi:hypothetical protein
MIRELRRAREVGSNEGKEVKGGVAVDELEDEELRDERVVVL